MSLKQVRTTILILILLIVVGAGGFRLGQKGISADPEALRSGITIDRTVPQKRNDIDFSLFWEVWDRLEEDYLKKDGLNKQDMVEGAISGMVGALGDPYTAFLPPSKNKESKDDLAGQFEGVGIQLGYNDSTLAVVAPLADTPAEKAGVKAGDLIVNIRDEAKGIDENTFEMSLLEAVGLIRGKKGTPVFLALVREGVRESFEVEIVRGTIVVKSVTVEFIDSQSAGGKVARLRLSRFGERTGEEWEEAVNEIRDRRYEIGDNFKGVILDLRNNPGGFLSGAVFIVSEFLDQGAVVLQDDGEGEAESFSVNRKGELTDVSLVILVNKGSASASEIVAGALKYHQRAKIVGQTTFGKGTIQEAQELEAGAGLHITIARWLIPDGTSIDKEGVVPDFEVEMDKEDPPDGETSQTKDPQLEKAIELLL